MANRQHTGAGPLQRPAPDIMRTRSLVRAYLSCTRSLLTAHRWRGRPPAFSMFCATVANAVWMGVEEKRCPKSRVNGDVRCAEGPVQCRNFGFILWFAVEVVLRLAVLRLGFFFFFLFADDALRWNFFVMSLLRLPSSPPEEQPKKCFKGKSLRGAQPW